MRSEPRDAKGVPSVDRRPAPRDDRTVRRLGLHHRTAHRLETRRWLIGFFALSLHCGNDDGGPVGSSGDPDAGTQTASVTFTAIYEEFLSQPGCAVGGCHGGPTGAGGLVLDAPADEVYEDLLAPPTCTGCTPEQQARYPQRVTAATATASYLYIKLLPDGAPEADRGGDAMPPGQGAPEDERERIRAWIARGAPEAP